MTVTLRETHVPTANGLDSRKELLKRTICKGASDEEIELFMHACKRTGLDPFMRQIYFIKRGNTMTIQTGIDGFRLIAERTGNYSPGKEPIFTYDEKGKVICATSYIKKRTEDNTWHEVGATAYMDEYNTGQGMWNKMPRTMIAKCSEALALRRAFPAELSGLYTTDEMDQANPIEQKSIFINEDEEMEIENYIVQIEPKNPNRIDALKKTLKIGEFSQMKSEDFSRAVKYLKKCIEEQERIENEQSTTVA